MGLLFVRSKFSNRFVSCKKLLSQFFSVFVLYKLFKANSVSSVNASMIKIHPYLSDTFFLTASFATKEKQQEHRMNCRGNDVSNFQSDLIFLLGMCFLRKKKKKKKPLGSFFFFLRYPKIFNCFLYDQRLLTLLEVILNLIELINFGTSMIIKNETF